MIVTRCDPCGGWALEGLRGGQHLASRLSPPAVCLGWDRRLSPAPKSAVPPTHRQQWWEHLPPGMPLPQEGDTAGPPAHSQAWGYLPAAPARRCTCGFYLAYNRWEAWDKVHRAHAVLLYVQAVGRVVLHNRGARCGRYRVLAYVPKWDGEEAIPTEAVRWVKATFGPLEYRPDILPTGVFDRVPPKVLELMEEVTE